MKYLFFFLCTFFLFGCSPELKKSFSKLSSPEKKWIAFHPFKAKKAFTTTIEVTKTIDSIANVGIIGTDNNGGYLDALKHSFWMAALTQQIGDRSAEKLGKAHEKGNYEHYLKNKMEDGLLPDKAASEMDLFNNRVGISVGKQFSTSSKSILIERLLDSLNEGKLRILSKDAKGNFLDCNNIIIPNDSLKKWDTKKCLVPSNFYKSFR